VGCVKTNDLPKGWRVAQLGEICLEDRVAISSDDPAYATMPYMGLEHIEPHTGKVLVSEQEARHFSSKSNNFRFNPEHVLYGKLRPYLNKVALPEFAGRCTTEIIPLKPNSVDRRWLAWLLRHQEVVSHAMHGKTGSRMPRASMTDFLTLLVGVPPLSEQRRIAARLQRQIAVIDRARSHAASELSAIAAMPRALLHEFIALRASPRPRHGWQWAKLADICGMVVGRTPKRANSTYWDGPYPWATIADMTASDGTVTKTRETLSDLGAAHCGPRLLPRGTLMFSFKLSIGQTAFAGCDLYTNEAIVGLRPHDGDLVNRHYLNFALQTVDYRGLAGFAAKGMTLNQRTLGALQIPVPKMVEQLQIVARIEQMTAAANRARAAIEAQLGAINELSAAAVQQAFTPWRP